MWFFIFLIVGYIIWSIGLYLLFPKAGIESWKGLVPFYNMGVLARMVGRSPYWALWLLFPIVNIFYYSSLVIDEVRSFGKYSFGESVLAVLFGPIYTIYLAMDKKAKFLGPAITQEKTFRTQLAEAHAAGNTKLIRQLEAKNVYKKSPAREWVESIIFAVFAASFIRMFLIEAFVIPTSSMEGSLLVGDFLFVSKANYGIRTPMTILAVPLLHNRIPVLNVESYLKKPSLPYFRLPALQSIQRNTPFVFNWPVGDSVYIMPDRSYTAGQVRRIPGLANMLHGSHLVVRPIDKKDHYIKRCVGLPGDTLQVIDNQLYINGDAQKNPEKMQLAYSIQSGTGQINDLLLDRLHINVSDRMGPSIYNLNKEQVIALQQEGLEVQIINPEANDVFPHDKAHYGSWTVSNYGPIYIPKKGVTVDLTMNNLALYRRLIHDYEHNDLEVVNGQILVNGTPATNYTFNQDYYWAMGDNRHNSEDSRMWGFVPEDHVVCKPLFIWFSTKNGSIRNGINWNRLFTSANKD